MIPRIDFCLAVFGGYLPISIEENAANHGVGAAGHSDIYFDVPGHGPLVIDALRKVSEGPSVQHGAGNSVYNLDDFCSSFAVVIERVDFKWMRIAVREINIHIVCRALVRIPATRLSDVGRTAPRNLKIAGLGP